MNYIIREAIKEDAYSIIHVVTISWNETYKGLIPDSYLKEKENNEEARGLKHYNEFDKVDYKELVLEINKEIVGFIRYGKSNDNEFTNCGEIYAFYIINKYHGLGLGRKLFEEAVSKLKELGFNKMIIACLKDNPTNEFYKHMGGKYIKDGLFEKLNLKENIYYYDI